MLLSPLSVDCFRLFSVEYLALLSRVGMFVDAESVLISPRNEGVSSRGKVFFPREANTKEEARRAADEAQ